MEAFAYRHSPLTLKVKELADSGTVGKLKVIEAWYSFSLSDLNNVRLKKDLSGGATYDVGCYALNVIRYIAGSEPVKVMATGEVGSESGVDESSCMLLEFADEITATFTMTAFTQHGERQVRVHGTEGEIAMRGATVTLRTFADNNEETITLGEEAGSHGGGDARVVNTWLHAIITGNRRGYFGDFGRVSDVSKAITAGFVYDGQHAPHRRRRHGAPATGDAGDRFVSFIQNHDQIANAYQGKRLAQVAGHARQKAAATGKVMAAAPPPSSQRGASSPWAAVASAAQSIARRRIRRPPQ
jgi:hypothetical protein